jgi:hypothetical protein
MKQTSFYSKFLDKFIKGEFLATSEFRQCDNRTCTTYFLDESMMVHSSDRNYSMLHGAKPIDLDSFISLWEKESPRYHAVNIIAL